MMCSREKNTHVLKLCNQHYGKWDWSFWKFGSLSKECARNLSHHFDFGSDPVLNQCLTVNLWNKLWSVWPPRSSFSFSLWTIMAAVLLGATVRDNVWDLELDRYGSENWLCHSLLVYLWAISFYLSLFYSFLIWGMRFIIAYTFNECYKN